MEQIEIDLADQYRLLAHIHRERTRESDKYLCLCESSQREKNLFDASEREKSMQAKVQRLESLGKTSAHTFNKKP